MSMKLFAVLISALSITACQTTEMLSPVVSETDVSSVVAGETGAILMYFDPSGVRAGTARFDFLFAKPVKKQNFLEHPLKKAFHIRFASKAHMSFIDTAEPIYAVKVVDPGTYTFYGFSGSGYRAGDLGRGGSEVKVEPGKVAYIGDFISVDGRLRIRNEDEKAKLWLEENLPVLSDSLSIAVITR